MVKTEWSTISLQSELLDKLDDFVLTDDAKELGYTSKSQIVSSLVRKFLDKEIDLSSKSNNINSIQSQLENKFDKKIDGLVEIISSVMAKHTGLHTDDENLLKLREKNIRKRLSSSEISKETKKKLSDIEKE